VHRRIFGSKIAIMAIIVISSVKIGELQAWPAFKPHHSDFCLLLVAGVLDSKRRMTEMIRLVHSWGWMNAG